MGVLAHLAEFAGSAAAWSVRGSRSVSEVVPAVDDGTLTDVGLSLL